MRWPGIPWKSVLQWRPDGPRLFKYAVIALALHVAATILQLPAALQYAENVGHRICFIVREKPRNLLNRFDGTDRFLRPDIYGLAAWPLSLEADLLALSGSLRRSCVIRAYPVGDLRAILLGDIELEVGSENPAQGLVLQLRDHMLWGGVSVWLPPGMTVVDHRHWHWPEGRPQAGAPAADSGSPP